MHKPIRINYDHYQELDLGEKINFRETICDLNGWDKETNLDFYTSQILIGEYYIDEDEKELKKSFFRINYISNLYQKKRYPL